MRLQVHKKGIRAFGVSESFVKSDSRYSILAGVVMRSDLILDGFSFSTATVGGMDSTQRIIDMYEDMGRDDINLILLNGCVISWYNVVDLNLVAETIGLPLICVTYRESKGLERFFRELFPEDYERRIEVYHRNGPRRELTLKTGKKVFIRFIGMDLEEAESILNKFTLVGAVPEPLRVARLLARSLMRSSLSRYTVRA
ncbi:hypothetical protein CP083_03190 [Candidatus Bathyarchaeota archaeon B24-2]|nr:MAG: hypothetical protein CP083_03190 [Candidatus Bathyarchaeota archaeon B24-2]